MPDTPRNEHYCVGCKSVVKSEQELFAEGLIQLFIRVSNTINAFFESMSVNLKVIAENMEVVIKSSEGGDNMPNSS